MSEKEKDIVISEQRDVKIVFKNHPDAPVIAWLFRKKDEVSRLLPMTYFVNKQGKGFILPLEQTNNTDLENPLSIVGFKINGEIFEGLLLLNDIKI